MSVTASAAAQVGDADRLRQEFEPEAHQPTPGSADLCLLVEEPVAAVAAEITIAGIAVVEGPVERTGAQGPIKSIYVRDPDGNLVELSNYPAS